MKVKIYKSDLRESLHNFMRKCGYMPFHDSYIKNLSVSGYPRFHIYVVESETEFIFNLHIDQKRPSYGKATAHSGEYEGKVVEDEADRIVDFL
ncbi:hypothetical protein KAJ41_00840 [Candidatus Parcubacteria bacterium]|nr:hypothetical protein [Candidatus Parcubacteria bacterium]